mmetsp:Transcript_21224/g.43485  ORF Transcript_21224/g.43485 Transcript_21224/m.43485 type:complete len:349 (-) Transcript_21224:1238-2284(-)
MLKISVLGILVVEVVLHLHGGIGQGLLQGVNSRRVKLTIAGELNTEQHIEAALHKRVAVTGHTLIGHNLDKGFATQALGLDDFTGFALDYELSAVQMLDDPLKAAKGLVETYSLGNEQIGTLALEGVVLLLLDDEVDITSLHVGLLVGHAAEGDLLVVTHALVDVDLQDLALLPPLALEALAGAGVAGTLDLLDHAESDLAELHDGALPVALGTFGRFADNDLTVDGELDRLAVVQVLQTHLQGVVDVVALSGSGRSPTSAASEEHGEEIIGARSSATLVGYSLKAVLIVLGPRLGIAENFIRSRNFLELGLLTALVGMVLYGKFSVGLLDLLGIGILVDLKVTAGHT